ncbi:LysM peptidoglycan-binding domain-containing protein [Chryseobacterium sp. MIQD13]|uniref:LysM peptidoglycan-binding domain-containing protein n=1 Tax=Chryseobacterium sp. MIQD13 TaxID=3422310 RepID=UPI003D271CB7
MQKFNIHTIQKGESLKSISSLYNLDTEALKLFHNNHGSVKDMILIELTGQKELFLPRTVVTDKSRLVKFGRANSLIFQPENSFSKYGTTITIENGEYKNELKYETSVRWLKKEGGLHFFEIDRTSNLYLNEEEVNEIADLLAYKTSKVLYPLQISVDEQGKFNDVENLSVFKERWSAVKEEVYKEFDGETVDTYCEKIEKVIFEPDAMVLYLKNDYFIRTLFFGIYQRFGPDYQIEMDESFPVVNNPVEPKYEIKLEIDPLKGESDLVNIEGEGRLNDERSAYDFINKAPFSMIIEDNPVMNHKGNFRIVAYLHGETLLLKSMYLECSIDLEKKKKISIVVAELQTN